MNHRIITSNEMCWMSIFEWRRKKKSWFIWFWSIFASGQTVCFWTVIHLQTDDAIHCQISQQNRSTGLKQSHAQPSPARGVKLNGLRIFIDLWNETKPNEMNRRPFAATQISYFVSTFAQVLLNYSFHFISFICCSCFLFCVWTLTWNHIILCGCNTTLFTHFLFAAWLLLLLFFVISLCLFLSSSLFCWFHPKKKKKKERSIFHHRKSSSLVCCECSQFTFLCWHFIGIIIFHFMVAVSFWLVALTLATIHAKERFEHENECTVAIGRKTGGQLSHNAHNDNNNNK